MGALMSGKKVPEFKTLFEQAVELGDAKVYPCSMAMDVLGVEQHDLESYLTEATGLTKFLGDARDGQVWTFDNRRNVKWRKKRLLTVAGAFALGRLWN